MSEKKSPLALLRHTWRAPAKQAILHSTDESIVGWRRLTGAVWLRRANRLFRRRRPSHRAGCGRRARNRWCTQRQRRLAEYGGHSQCCWRPRHRRCTQCQCRRAERRRRRSSQHHRGRPRRGRCPHRHCRRPWFRRCADQQGWHVRFQRRPNGKGGAPGAGASPGVIQACQVIAGNSCQQCLCTTCSSQIVDCLSNFGCALILACAQQSGCQGLECYSAQTCRPVIDQFGGLTGKSMGSVLSLVSCSVGSQNSCSCN